MADPRYGVYAGSPYAGGPLGGSSAIIPAQSTPIRPSWEPISLALPPQVRRIPLSGTNQWENIVRAYQNATEGK